MRLSRVRAGPGDGNDGPQKAPAAPGMSEMSHLKGPAPHSRNCVRTEWRETRGGVGRFGKVQVRDVMGVLAMPEPTYNVFRESVVHGVGDRARSV